MKRLRTFPLIVVATLLGSSLALTDQIQPLLDIGEQRQNLEQASQTKIDSMDDDTSLIVNEFKTVSKQIEGLRVYNAQMRKQIERQEERLKEIDKTMKEAQVMQRQIPPFTRRMLAGIEKSIELDMPFHLAERKERIAFAKAAIDNPTVSPAEGLRQVLETFNVEMEYGRKLDSYKDTIEIEGQQREVNVLRVGRLALVYQSSDRSLTGAWDNKKQEWVPLDNSYRNPTGKGLRIANRLATVDMLELPIQNAEAVK
jgi:septal ring factor EnvC (AmiA/AmiB activator)